MATPSLLTTLLILSAALAFLAPSSFADYVLLSENILESGQRLEYGNYSLLMQSNCNLVLYDSNKAVWSTNTVQNHGQCRLKMQTDGNIVIYNSDNKAIWSTRNSGRSGSHALILQPDRNLVIYGPGVWATRTNIPSRKSTKSAVVSAVVAGDEILGK